MPGIIYWRGEEAVTNYLLMAPAAQVLLDNVDNDYDGNNNDYDDNCHHDHNDDYNDDHNDD